MASRNLSATRRTNIIFPFLYYLYYSRYISQWHSTGNGWKELKWVSTWWGRDQRFESRSDPKSPSLGSGCFLSNWSQHRLGIVRTLNRDQKMIQQPISWKTSSCLISAVKQLIMASTGMWDPLPVLYCKSALIYGSTARMLKCIANINSNQSINQSMEKPSYDNVVLHLSLLVLLNT